VTFAPIHVFGCSHAKFFFNTPQALRRLGEPYASIDIEGRFLRAASVAGFRPRRSTLDTKEAIQAALPQVNALCLAFGQVDLELGYYYRRVIKEENIVPQDYIDWLTSIYAEFVDALPLRSDQIAFKGVNLTVLSEPQFVYRYVKRTIKQASDIDKETTAARLRSEIMSEEQQNALSLGFNESVRHLAARRGSRYFDLVEATRDRSSPKPRLAPVFVPAEFDHHFADSLEIRRLHLEGLTQAFA
jgi:hypothetical protein